MRMIIVSGLSGSGKSIALQTLEDLGYYCIDNLPLGLLRPFADTLLTRSSSDARTTAVGIDARNFSDELQQFPAILTQLRQLGLDVEVLFLHADDSVLLKRYSETRRKHPLSDHDLPLADAIIANAALIVDSSNTNIHELRELIRQRVHASSQDSLSLLVQSFGYKKGVPLDVDFVFDVRCLPNPHWEPKLRELSGLDTAVKAFLSAHEQVAAMVSDIDQFMHRWIPQFETGSRSYLSLAIGCTGGHHRSVYIVEQLAEKFSENRHHVVIRHRDLSR